MAHRAYREGRGGGGGIGEQQVFWLCVRQCFLFDKNAEMKKGLRETGHVQVSRIMFPEPDSTLHIPVKKS